MNRCICKFCVSFFTEQAVWACQGISEYFFESVVYHFGHRRPSKKPNVLFLETKQKEGLVIRNLYAVLFQIMFILTNNLAFSSCFNSFSRFWNSSSDFAGTSLKLISASFATLSLSITSTFLSISSSRWELLPTMTLTYANDFNTDVSGKKVEHYHFIPSSHLKLFNFSNYAYQMFHENVLQDCPCKLAIWYFPE